MTKYLSAALLAALCGTVLAGNTPPPRAKIEVAAPFGITIGKTTCLEAAEILGRRGSRMGNGNYLVEAGAPEKLYPKATAILAQCPKADKPVLWLKIAVNEGVSGGAPKNRDIFNSLYDKYAVESGIVKRPNWMADTLFVDATGDTVIKFEAYIAGVFSVTYMNRASFNKFEALAKADAENRARKAAEAAAQSPATRF